MILNNTNITVRNSQQNNLCNENQVDKIINYLRERVAVAPYEIKVLNALRFYHNMHGQKFFPSQATLAARAGCSREWVNKAIKKFVGLGWVTKIYSHRRACTYSLHSIFSNKKLRWAIKDMLPQFKWEFKGILKDLFSYAKTQFTPITKVIYLLNTTTTLPKIKRTIYSQKQRWFLQNKFKKIREALKSVPKRVQSGINFILPTFSLETVEEKQAKIEKAKVREPHNYWLHRFPMPGMQ